MRQVLLSTAAALIVCLLASSAAMAHFGGGAYLIVPADHVNPGQPFEVIGADLTPDSTVELTIVRDDRVDPLGTSVSGADGHFQTELRLPADFPGGYALLTATATDGTTTSTWVLVGARTASTPPAPATRQWWTDPSVIVLGVLVIGVLALVALALFRRRVPQRLPVRAVARPGCPAGRRSTKGKRSRR